MKSNQPTKRIKNGQSCRIYRDHTIRFMDGTSISFHNAPDPLPTETTMEMTRSGGCDHKSQNIASRIYKTAINRAEKVHHKATMAKYNLDR